MKNIFLFISIISSQILFGQTLNSVQEMPKDNYLMCAGAGDSVYGNFIFQKSKKVFYGYNRKTKVADNSYTANAKMVKDLFKYASAVNWNEMVSLDEKNVPDIDKFHYHVLEYKMNGVLKRICWNEKGTDDTSIEMNALLEMMNAFW